MPVKERDTEYSNLVKMYNILNDQVKDLKDKADKVKEDIAVMMHEDSINENMIDVDGIVFKVAYQGRTTKKVDYNQLLQLLGQNGYQEVVTENQSEFLSIRKAPKGQQNNILHTAPNGAKKKLDPPIGNLA